jgi:hypothetical protein
VTTEQSTTDQPGGDPDTAHAQNPANRPDAGRSRATGSDAINPGLPGGPEIDDPSPCTVHRGPAAPLDDLDRFVLRTRPRFRELHHVVHLVQNLARDLDQAIAHSRSDTPRPDSRRHLLGSAVLHTAHELAGRVDHALARTLARDLDHARNDDDALTRALATDLARARLPALTRAHQDMGALALALAGDLDRDLGLGLDTTDLEALADHLSAIGDDFVAADLSGAAHLDLGPGDLRGIRWTPATTDWPDGWACRIQDVSIHIGHGVLEIWGNVTQPTTRAGPVIHPSAGTLPHP